MLVCEYDWFSVVFRLFSIDFSVFDLIVWKQVNISLFELTNVKSFNFANNMPLDRWYMLGNWMIVPKNCKKSWAFRQLLQVKKNKGVIQLETAVNCLICAHQWYIKINFWWQNAEQRDCNGGKLAIKLRYWFR